MNVHLRERYRNALIVKGSFAVFQKIHLDIPIHCGIGPYDKAVLDGTVTVLCHYNARRRLNKHPFVRFRNAQEICLTFSLSTE